MDTTLGADTGSRRVIASFDRHEDAQALVDRLALSGFQVERLSIVGSDLRLVETVTGRMSAWRAALAGALSGAFWGGLLGWLFGVVFTHDGVSGLAIFLYLLILGAAFGALLGIVAYAFSSRREFMSITGVQANRYDVLADAAVADEALRLAKASVPGSPSQAG